MQSPTRSRPLIGAPDLFAKRAKLMAQWGAYLAKPVRAADVSDLDAERKKRRG
jgi:hypothetical protein